MQIYNNTISAQAGDAPFIAMDFTSQPNGNCNGLYIRNNIVVGFRDAWLRGSNGATNITNATVTHNDAFGNGSNVPSWPAGNPANYIYNNNLSVNPQFVSSTDFHLLPTSPLIDIGIYVGTAYNGTGPDRGYTEFGAPPLPVKLIDFNVKENNGKNLLHWTTATEANSDHFNIQRSTDAQSYETIGSVNAAGFSTTETKYNFTDATPSKGVNYYRLVMVDKDATFEYSKIISITNKDNHSVSIIQTELSARANTVSVIVSSTKMQTANLSIIDISGRTVFNIGIQLQNGNNIINKTVPNLSGGIYYIKLLTTNETVVKNTISH